MPTPKEGESRDDYMSRCMGDDKMNDEFGNPKQRAAVCNSYFEDKKAATAKMEDYLFRTPEGARKKSKEIGFDGEIHESTLADDTKLYSPAKTEKEFIEWYRKNDPDAKEELTALQYGKPGKDDARKTPAKPSERRKGSKKNKPGSAKKPNKSISMSKETESRIRKLMEEHNKKVASKNKGSKASMGMLKSVFRRGAGAFSRSHAPNMSRSGWGVARVKAFLYLMRNGRPSNPNYKQDNDLLPNSHPRGKKADEEYEDWGMAMEAAKYQGRTVTLNKPFRTQGGKKKFAVYVKNSAGKVIIVRFGDPNMEIKRDDPKRRKAFRDRHNCAEKKDKTTPGYWSCYQWRKGSKVESSEEFNKTDDTVSADMGDCGCGCDGESVEAKMIRKDVFDNPGEAAGRAKELGLEGFHSHKEDGETVFMPGKNHEEYMKKVGKDIPKKEQDVEGYYDKDEEKKASYHSDGGSCRDGYEKQGDMCVRVAVTCDITIDNIEARVEATTGKTVIRISGVAFTDGINKNNWGIRAELAAKLADEMVGADITLNHPKAEMGRFRRNMEGGVDEAVVGEVTEASYVSRADGYVVKYVGEVHRSELFSALESGLWMRADYGVSIGGTGIPSEIIEAEDGGRPTMWFADEFDFDHLAIVHKPAYREANIEKAVKVEANESFKYQPEGSTDYSKVNEMTDEIIDESNNASEMEALRAELVLREAKIAEFEAAEVARAEDARVALVEKATELGLKGHDDFSAETLNSVIASWEASRPAPVEEVVEMTPAEPASSEPVKASEDSEPVVANYLNGKVVSSKETLYARAYNAWVDAYNGVMINADESPALTYEELKTKRII